MSKSSSLPALLVALVVGCGGTAPAPAQAKPSPESELVFASTGGPAIAFEITLLTAWGNQHGIKVTSVQGTSASLVAKVQAQKNGQIDFDLFQSNDQSVALGRAQGLWHTIDLGLITNRKLIDESYAFPKDVVGTPPVGMRLGMYPIGLAYNISMFQKNGWDPPTSWTDLYNPKYAKCLTPLNPGGMAAYMAMLNYVTGKDYANIGPTVAKFEPIAKSVPSFATNLTQAEQLLQNGTSCLIPDQDGRTYALQQNGASVGFVRPKEGLALLSGDVMIPKNAPHPVAAQMAIDYLISTEASQQELEKGFSTTCNLQVKRPATGLASKLVIASEFKQAGVTQIPVAAYNSLDDWSRQWNQMSARS
jgi:putative spermidine/putrescine transport system substrate-binding protein